MTEVTLITHVTVRQQVAEIMRRKILTGKYLPGDRIKELELSSELGTSRGPVREAMRQLEEEGLVTYVPNKGCFVTTLDPKDAWEIYVLRAELESLSTRLCTGDIGEFYIEKMADALKAMIKAAEEKDLNELVEQDHNFHSCICKAAKSKHLLKLWTSLNSTSFAIFLTVTSANIRSLDQIASRHMEILNALRSKDQEIICQAIRDHYLSTGIELFNRQHGLSSKNFD